MREMRGGEAMDRGGRGGGHEVELESVRVPNMSHVPESLGYADMRVDGEREGGRGRDRDIARGMVR